MSDVRELLPIETRPEVRKASESLTEPIKAAARDGVIVIAVLIDTKDPDRETTTSFFSTLAADSLLAMLKFGVRQLQAIKTGGGRPMKDEVLSNPGSDPSMQYEQSGWLDCLTPDIRKRLLRKKTDEELEALRKERQALEDSLKDNNPLGCQGPRRRKK